MFYRKVDTKKGSSGNQSGLPWEIEVHVITTLLSADWLQGPAEPPGGNATRLFFSQVAYLVHDNLDILMFSSVLVGLCVRSELSCEEDFLSFLEELPRDDLLVVVEFLLEDDAAEEASALVILCEVLGECESCESLTFVRCHVCSKSA